MSFRTGRAKRIALMIGIMLLISLFALPVFADDTTGGTESATVSGSTASDSSAFGYDDVEPPDDSIIEEESEDVAASDEDAAYWEYVRKIQMYIRGRHAGRYGMTPVYGQDVADGTYEITVTSNSQYFKIAKAELTVKDGEMTAQITIPSMSYTNVFLGTAKEASKAKESEWIGFQEVDKQTVFTIPVEALNKEIDCAALSKARKKWYDRKIVFDASSLPEDALRIDLPDFDLIEEAIKAYGADNKNAAEILYPETQDGSEENPDADPNQVKESDYLLTGDPVAVDIDYPDGEYSIEVNMVGGSGRASISSPTWLIVRDGKAYAKLLWSSAYYDYMVIGDQKYYNLTKDGGNSTFEIPIVYMDESFPVIADTTAMDEPVEIRYELTFYQMTIGSKGRIPQEAAKKVLIIAAAILVVGGVLNFIVKKKRKQ